MGSASLHPSYELIEPSRPRFSRLGRAAPTYTMESIVEAAVAPLPILEGLGAGQGLAAVDNLHPASELIGDRRLERQLPLGIGTGAVGEHAALGKGGDGVGQFLGCGTGLPRR